jgi:LDH2 family malate/lactate/ureidoglycolate dehydrogenase
MPGEDRRNRRAERSANGVTLSATLMKQLDDLAADLKIGPLAGR